MDFQKLENRLSNIETLLIGSKKLLSLDEVATYTGLSKSYLYKKTSQGALKHSKPTGKVVFVKMEDLENFLQQNTITTQSEIEIAANTYVATKGKGGVKC